MRPIDAVLGRFPDARKSGNGWSARCPAHEDRHPSLSIAEGDDGRVLLKCHAGCATEDVCRSKNLRLADLMPERPTRAIRHTQQRSGFPTAEAAIHFLERKLGPRSRQWDYFDDAGVRVGGIVRWDTPDGKVIRPICLRDGEWTSGGMSAPRPLYRLGEVKAAETVVITEGEKAADAAAILGYAATTSAHGAQSPRSTDWTPLAGKDVVILPDNDPSGTAYAESVVAILAALDPPPSIKIVTLPDLPENGDIADLVDNGDLQELRERVDALIVETSPVQRPSANLTRSESDRPQIWIENGEKPRITDQSLAVLAQDHFERGRQLVRCLPSSRGFVIVPVTAEAVDDTLNRRAAFARKIDDDGGFREKKESAPAWLAGTIVGMQVWPGIRPLEGVHHGPCLREDGSIGGIRPGYDARLRCWVDCTEDWTELERPTTKSEVDAAVATLRDVVSEFPFESESAESVWIALLLTRLARSAFQGPSPLFVIDATTPGSGKTMLARLAGVVADGRSPGMMSFSKSDEETRKAITSALQEGASFLVFDNVGTIVASPCLDRLLTSTSWGDRILGRTQMVTLPNLTVPVITANNCQIEGETLRRSLFLRLAPLQELPENRTFRITDLDGYVLKNRRRLVIAAMRILQWHVQCGRPQRAVRPFGSFESWSSVVRQAVIHADLPDPVVTVTVRDAGRSTVETFLRCWWAWNRNWQGTARHLVAAAFDDNSATGKALQEASLELVGRAGEKDGRPEPQALGNALGRFQGRTFSDLRVLRLEKREASGFAWRLEEITQTSNLCTPGTQKCTSAAGGTQAEKP